MVVDAASHKAPSIQVRKQISGVSAASLSSLTLSSSVRIASWPLPLEDYGVATGLSPSPRVLSSSTRSRIERHPPLSLNHLLSYSSPLSLLVHLLSLFHVGCLSVHPRFLRVSYWSFFKITRMYSLILFLILYFILFFYLITPSLSFSSFFLYLSKI